MKTLGISPKAIAAVVSAVLTYIVTQTVLDLPSWAVVLSQAVLIGLAAYTASPGDVVPKADVASDDLLLADKGARDRLADAGQSSVDLVVKVLVVIVLVLFALALLGTVID